MVELTNDEQIIIRKEFESLEDPLTIQLRMNSDAQQNSPDLKDLIKKIADHDERLKLEIDEVGSSADEESPHELIPEIRLIDKEGTKSRIFFHGTPSINAFPSLVRAIRMVSSGKHDLDEAIVERAKALESTDLEVLITPNTPGAAQMLDIAYALAYAAENITAHGIELIEFPDVAEKYRVLGFPKTVANGSLKFTGIYSLEEIMQILEKKISDADD
ncbi:MAG: thioredoxin family protein [Candidatus Thermoplasmatota archaeon]|nr:thioredoxin family protein [Candidatus Thermoplasmatota archaeon]